MIITVDTSVSSETFILVRRRKRHYFPGSIGKDGYFIPSFLARARERIRCLENSLFYYVIT